MGNVSHFCSKRIETTKLNEIQRQQLARQKSWQEVSNRHGYIMSGSEASKTMLWSTLAVQETILDSSGLSADRVLISAFAVPNRGTDVSNIMDLYYMGSILLGVMLQHAVVVLSLKLEEYQLVYFHTSLIHSCVVVNIMPKMMAEMTDKDTSGFVAFVLAMTISKF